MRDYVCLIEATIEPLRHNRRIFYKQVHHSRKESAEARKPIFQNEVSDIVTFHWDGQQSR